MRRKACSILRLFEFNSPDFESAAYTDQPAAARRDHTPSGFPAEHAPNFLPNAPRSKARQPDRAPNRPGDRTYKLHSGITSEYGRYAKSPGGPVTGMDAISLFGKGDCDATRLSGWMDSPCVQPCFLGGECECRFLLEAAYGPQSSLENPRVPLQPVPDMAQGVEWAFEIPIRNTDRYGCAE